jgi:hypothetical protein
VTGHYKDAKDAAVRRDPIQISPALTPIHPKNQVYAEKQRLELSGTSLTRRLPRSGKEEATYR